jgi:hypothetical protein
MIKATVRTTGINRVSINKQSRDVIKTVNIIPNKLEYLLDVDASDPDNNETLVYDAAAGKYVIKELPVINGGNF